MTAIQSISHRDRPVQAFEPFPDTTEGDETAYEGIEGSELAGQVAQRLEHAYGFFRPPDAFDRSPVPEPDAGQQDSHHGPAPKVAASLQFRQDLLGE